MRIKKKLGKVISCFAGLGCGELALKNVGVDVDKVYAYEIDKYAEAVNKYHNQKTNFLGDITRWKEHKELIGEGVDLIMGGSPCQDLSIAGYKAGLTGARSGLVYEFAEMVKYYKPKYFFLENVASMKKAERDAISELMGVEPVKIDSAGISAQSRKRLYWTNLPYVEPETSENICVVDILEKQAKRRKRAYSTIELHEDITERSFKTVKLGYINGRSNSQENRIYSIYGKSPVCRAKVARDLFLIDGEIVMLNISEMEALQTLPVGYTKIGLFKTPNGFDSYRLISDTQRGKMIGNGWTVRVIEQFFRSI